MNGPKSWNWLGGLTVGLALLMAAPAAAQERGGGGDQQPGCRDPRLISRFLRLSEDQRKSWQELRTDLRESAAPLHEALGPLHDELAALLDTASPDACTVGGVVVEIDGARDQLADLRDAYEDDFAALLTPEQLERWERLQAHCRSRDEAVGAP